MELGQGFSFGRSDELHLPRLGHKGIPALGTQPPRCEEAQAACGEAYMEEVCSSLPTALADSQHPLMSHVSEPS